MRVLICGGGVSGGFLTLDWCEEIPLAPGARGSKGPALPPATASGAFLMRRRLARPSLN